MNVRPSLADNTVSVDLSLDEVSHLMACLMHAKFSDDPKSIVYLSPTLNTLIAGLLYAGKAMGETTGWFDTAALRMNFRTDGLQPPAAFPVIRSELEFEFPDGDQAALLEEALYPFTATGEW